jgi:hypothetical protein
MPIHESFEVKRGVGMSRPVGECTLVEAVEVVKHAIARSRTQRVAALLISARGIYGVPIPNLIDRFLAVEDWADAAQGMLSVALVVHPKYIHPQRFGVKVASDFGLSMDVFTSETNALAWLAREM